MNNKKSIFIYFAISRIFIITSKLKNLNLKNEILKKQFIIIKSYLNVINDSFLILMIKFKFKKNHIKIKMLFNYEIN